MFCWFVVLLFAQFSPLPHDLNDSGQQGDENNRHDQNLEVFLDERQVAKEVSGIAKQGHPEGPADHVVHHEIIVMHLAHARHERGERPDNRHEPGDDDGLAAIFLIELMRLFQMAPLEDLGVGIVEQPLPEEMADHVIAGIAENRRGEQD